MEINIKMNNMILTDDITKLKFGELTVGQQILILEDKQTPNLEIEYNNIITAFLTRKEKGCLYYFEGVNTNAEVYEEEIEIPEDQENDEIDEVGYEVGGSEYNAKNYLKYFLVLSEEQQIKIELNKLYIQKVDKGEETKLGYPHPTSISNFKDMIHVIKDSKYISSKKIINADDKNNIDAEFLLCVPIDNNCFIGYVLSHNIVTDSYHWYKDERMFLFDETFTWCVHLDCDEQEVFKEILKLDCTRWSTQLDEFKDTWLPAFNYDVKDYITNPIDIFTVYKAFGYSSYLSNAEIEKYYKPFYQEDEYDLKFYMNSITANYRGDVRYTYDNKKLPGYSWDSNVKDIIGPATRKAKAILQFLKKSSIINPFSGEPISNDNFIRVVTWHDAGGKIIESAGIDECKGNNYKNYFTDLNGIFVDAGSEDIKDMDDRIKLVNQLTQLPIAK